MKNNSFKKISIILFFFILILNSISQSSEFEFNGKEIDIVDNGKKILGYNGIEIFLNNKKQKITANKFKYDKIKKTLTIIGKIKFIDTSAEIEILSDEAVYNEEKKKLRI
jgi:lipopolysaccharide assembly outer membrane protein LptD (OstA)